MADQNSKPNSHLALRLREVAQVLKAEFGDIAAAEIMKSVVRVDIKTDGPF